MSMISSTGKCVLSEGTFYIDGQIELPNGATLEGSGKNTIIRSLTSYEGALIVMGKLGTVKNLTLQANGTASSTIGEEVGILIYDTKTDSSSPSTHDFANNVIENVYFDTFNGSGIEMRGTGGSVNFGSIISNCVFTNCSVGLNIGFFSEYHKIDSCIFGNTNYIGIINNGGNNVFTNCTISGSSKGFVIDNSAGNLVNSAHGSCVGCLFNHTGDNTGNGIEIHNIQYGFNFSGCHFWYGTILIDGSSGILFNGLEGGGNTNTINITNSNTIVFNNMLFNMSPSITITNSDNIKFIECYNFTNNTQITGEQS